MMPSSQPTGLRVNRWTAVRGVAEVALRGKVAGAVNALDRDHRHPEDDIPMLRSRRSAAE